MDGMSKNDEDEKRKRRQAWWRALEKEDVDFVRGHAGSEEPRQLLAYFQAALRDRRWTTVKILLEEHENGLPPQWKGELLSRLSSAGDLEGVRYLLELGVGDLNQGSPLIYASMGGHLEVARALLEAGADPNHGDPRFGNALNFAEPKGNTAIVELIRAYGGKPLVLTGPDTPSSAWKRTLKHWQSELTRLWRVVSPPDRKRVLRALNRAIPASFQHLVTNGGEQLLGFALCTDPDFRTLYATGYRASDLAQFDDESCRYHPAEWVSLEGGGAQLDRASDLLGLWADQHYSNELETVGPDDDHLREWKFTMVEETVRLLLHHRDKGNLGQGIPIIFTCHDGNDWWMARIEDATRRLNTPEFFEAWRKVGL